MNKHLDHSTGPKNRVTAALWPSRTLLVLMSAALLWAGCAAKTTATVNRDVTTVIAGAGAAANQAATEYNNKTIAQTPTARNAINTLGAAYEEARAAFVTVLSAQAAYQAAEQVQLQACTPANVAGSTGAGGGNCAATTQTATAAQAKLTAAESDLNNALANLSNQTKAVQALK